MSVPMREACLVAMPYFAAVSASHGLGYYLESMAIYAGSAIIGRVLVFDRNCVLYLRGST